MLQLSSIQKLHEHDQRPSGPAVARFDHLHLTGAYLGKFGQTGLCMSAAFADRLECGGGHVLYSVQSHGGGLSPKHTAPVFPLRRQLVTVDRGGKAPARLPLGGLRFTNHSQFADEAGFRLALRETLAVGNNCGPQAIGANGAQQVGADTDFKLPVAAITADFLFCAFDGEDLGGHVRYSVAVEPLLAHNVRVVNRLCNVSANYFSVAWKTDRTNGGIG